MNLDQIDIDKIEERLSELRVRAKKIMLCTEKLPFVPVHLRFEAVNSRAEVTDEHLKKIHLSMPVNEILSVRGVDDYFDALEEDLIQRKKSSEPLQQLCGASPKRNALMLNEMPEKWRAEFNFLCNTAEMLVKAEKVYDDAQFRAYLDSNLNLTAPMR